MKTLELDIFSDTDEDEVMKHLRVLEDRHIIGLRKSKSTVLPGDPLTVEQLNRQIEKSEMSRAYTPQEARKYLGI
jgi:hypothetical protein